VLIRSGQGNELRRAHLLPSELVTFATGPDVEANGPRVKSFRGEEALLTKFLEVSDPRDLTICYTQGHGEPAFDDLEPYNGYAHLRDLLRDASLETQIADLDNESCLDACDLLLVAGPRGALPPDHVAAVRRFAERGRDILIFAGAESLRSKAELIDHGLEPLTAEYGVSFGRRQVFDPNHISGASKYASFVIEQGWADHPAVRSLVMQPVAFFDVRELSVGRDAVALAWTSAQGWA